MVMSYSGGIPPASSVFAVYASISAFIMLLQTMLNQLIPRHHQRYALDIIRRLLSPHPTTSTVVIEERDGISGNELYSAAETYLCAKIRPNIERLKISKRPKETGLNIKFAQSEEITDCFNGMNLTWRFFNVERKKASKVIDEDTDNIFVESEKRYFELSFDKNHKNQVLDTYFPFVLEKAKTITDEKKVVKLHTLACGSSAYTSSIMWDSINLEHPSTFDTLAMAPSQKETIIEDLDRFVRRKEFYRRVGRAWKRGYLLYGPPGTGKSSLIAAMANYLKFDIYDLELANVRRDSDLRRLLLRTANRSILVIEDIDCTVELPDRKGPAAAADGKGQGHHSLHDHRFTLSGLLNFIDGLWSSCGDERIILFTTNNKDRLDPALLRPGRMDMHIHMSYLMPEGFRLLASTYLDLVQHHPRMSEIEDLIGAINITPAEVAEELMKNDDADTTLDGLVDFLKCKKQMMMMKGKKKKSNNDGVVDGDVAEGAEEDPKAKEFVCDEDIDIELVMRNVLSG